MTTTTATAPQETSSTPNKSTVPSPTASLATAAVDDDHRLLTPQSLALSLSAPRAPPHASPHWRVYQGQSPADNHKSSSSKPNKNNNPAWWKLHYSVTDGRGTHAFPSFRVPRTVHQERLHQKLWRAHRHGSGADESPKKPKRQPRRFQIPSAASTTRFSLWTAKPKKSTGEHPHLPKLANHGTTRFLGQWLSVSKQNQWRDDGTFRAIVDWLVTYVVAPCLVFTPIAVPPSVLLSVTAPVEPPLVVAAWKAFLQATRQCQTLRYGTHERQYVHLYEPVSNNDDDDASSSSATNPPRVTRLLFFIHGGAWGSGYPWMYRLVAAPWVYPHSKTAGSSPQQEPERVVIAIPGYRTYPDSPRIMDQVEDVAQAYERVVEHYGDTMQNVPVTVVGHSSGAHVGLLWLIQRAKQQQQQQQQQQQRASPDGRTTTTTTNTLAIDSFVGISGPYNISHHFDYEAARGVEEVSPLKPICGSTREAFRTHSPALALQDALAWATTTQTTEATQPDDRTSTNASPLSTSPTPSNTLYASEPSLVQGLPSTIVLIHAIEDDVVPFTSTADAARILRSCGVPQCWEYYVGPGTDHQGTVMELMVGKGPTWDIFVQVVQYLNQQQQQQQQNGETAEAEEQPIATTRMAVASRL